MSGFGNFISQAFQRLAHACSRGSNRRRITGLQSCRKIAYIQLLIVCPGCLNAGAPFLAKQLTGNSEHQIFQTCLTRSQYSPQIVGGSHHRSNLVNLSKDGILGFEQLGISLGTQTKAITQPSSNEVRKNQYRQRPQGIIWYLKCAGWYLCHHLWLFPLGWFVSGAFGYLLSVVRYKTGVRALGKKLNCTN